MKKALLISPPVYDTQYWERWSMPHGLLKVATYLRNAGYETRLIDCLASDGKNKLRMRKRELVRVGTRERWIPKPWNARSQADVKIVYSFGKNVDDLRAELRNHISAGWDPDEIWITSIMSYWWESTRDVILACKQYYPRAKIRVGG